VVAETLTISSVSGTVGTVNIAANENLGDASKAVANLNAIDGVTATGSNTVVLSNLTSSYEGDTGTSYGGTLVLADGTATASIDLGSYVEDDGTITDASMAAIAAAIGTDTSNAFTASYNSDTGELTVTAASAKDIDVSIAGLEANGANNTNASVDVAGANSSSATNIASTADTAQGVSVSGTITVALAEGLSMTSTKVDGTGLFADAAVNDTTGAVTTVKTGVADTTGGNNVGAQTLTIVGPNGSAPAVEIAAGSTANAVATAVNAETATTGVSAEARTVATLSDLSANGTVSFTLQGNTEVAAVEIEATVTADDLSALAKAINDKSGATGITAQLSGSNNEITLTQDSGYNIAIGNFAHSDTASQTMNVTGNQGDATKLVDDGTGTYDSTVVGGEVTFSASDDFNITSSIAEDATGGNSLFAAAAGEANVSDLASIADVDITTVEGAANAIKSIDGALAQIDTFRGDLGAVQNRFESTIANLQNVSENLSAARSRILDADIAEETSNMTKQNILQQAGVSILAQANQAPQLALSLLG
jgi:flagellin